MKKIIYFLLLIVWLFIIYILSNQNGQISGGNSISIIKMILNFCYEIFDISKESLPSVLNMIHNPIRELAHAFEYFVLSFLVLKNLINFKIKENKYIVTLIFCFVYAVFDEIHQLFIDGRAFQYLDIMMDMIGATTFVIIYKFICILRGECRYGF